MSDKVVSETAGGVAVSEVVNERKRGRPRKPKRGRVLPPAPRYGRRYDWDKLFAPAPDGTPASFLWVQGRDFTCIPTSASIMLRLAAKARGLRLEVRNEGGVALRVRVKGPAELPGRGVRARVPTARGVAS